LSDAGVQDLQKFGQNIENGQKKNSDKKVKARRHKSKKLIEFIKKLKKKCYGAITKLSKIIIAGAQQTNKQLHSIIRQIRQWQQIKSTYLQVRQRQCVQYPCYKLVETQKQHGNKTIVIRKRVPVKLNDRSQQTIFRLPSDFCENYNLENKGTTGKHLKKSIWDVPVKFEEGKEKWKIFDFWRNW
jgi:hypothetical protein